MSELLPQLAERLDETLCQATLTAEARSWGQSLLDRLRAPVQVVVLGPAGSGKSSVIDILSGEASFPKGLRLPVIELVGGPRESARAEMADGQSVTLSPQAPVPPGARRLTLSVQNPVLEECSFAEVRFEPDQNGAALTPELEWAFEQADIILWCSRDFDAAEQEVWSRVPDELKDHSYLVLTHADVAIADGSLEDRIHALTAVVEEEFLGLFPIAAPLALAGRTDWLQGRRDGPGAQWPASGAGALSDTIHKRIQHGRIADQDSARLFLSRFAGLRQTSSAGQAPTPEVPTPPAPKQASACRSAFRQAQEILQRHADRMLAAAEARGVADAAAVLDSCVAAADDLANLLAQTDGADAQVCALRDDLAESSEMMMLFQLERTEDAAADAVCLLMQINRELADGAVG